MNNFNMTRFVNFMKWDLTINKTFYRNFVIVTIAGIVAITFLSFWVTWLSYGAFNVSYDEGTGSNFITGSSFINMKDMYITAMIISFYIGLIMCVYAGCIFHNLRNKQGRISELTLPATNLEKFLWHVIGMIGGGVVVCLAGILVADAVNALLVTLSMSSEYVGSLTKDFFKLIFLNVSEGMKFSSNSFSDVFRDVISGLSQLAQTSFVLAIFASLSAYIAIYAFGNAVKYKFNIILTYIALQVLEVAFQVVAFIFASMLSGSETLIQWLENYLMTFKNTSDVMPIILNGTVVLNVIIAVVLWFWTYRLYTRAAVTSSLNR